MKTKIHFHSDCSFFAGCENMLANFFNSTCFTEKYDVSFSYRTTYRYDAGFKSRIKNIKITVFPLVLLDISSIYNSISKQPKWIQKGLKGLVNLFMIKYIFVLYNTIILLNVFNKRKIDILHVNNGGYPGAYSCASAVIAAKLVGINKIVYVVNNIAVPYKNISRIIDYFLDRIVASNVTFFVTGSKYAGTHLLKVLGVNENKVKNIYNGISTRSVTEDRKTVLSRLGLDDRKFYLGIVAIHEVRKGHVYLFKAIQKLKKILTKEEMPVLLVEGEGPLTDQLFKFIKDNSLEKNILFIGNEKNVFNFMNAIDLIVLPSISNEDFPNVVLEAMSLGKIIIASKIAGVPEQIEHMKTGIIVEPQNIDDLAHFIYEIIINRDKYVVLGSNAKQVFNDRFTDDVAISNYDLLYNNELERIYL